MNYQELWEAKQQEINDLLSANRTIQSTNMTLRYVVLLRAPEYLYVTVSRS